jgi:hypothetical protein
MRPRSDGGAPRPPNKHNLTELYLQKVKPQESPYNVWDTGGRLTERGLVLRVQPSGQWAFKFVYPYRGRPRWFHIGQIGLADARRLVLRLRAQVAEGKDPAGERLAARQAERTQGTFGELADRYLVEHAKRNNKSWPQARKLVERYLLPRWKNRKVEDITRSEVRLLISQIAAEVLANQVLASASAVFSWGVTEEVIKVNPCHGIKRHPTRSRSRVLFDSELPQFWAEFDKAGRAGAALKTILLLGQRPGETGHMRAEHIRDGWWEMPGAPVEGKWPGTKNGQNHRVWLPEPVQALLADRKATGFVFGEAVTDLDRVMLMRPHWVVQVEC